MGTDEIFNYVMETPENTNPNVLRSLLNNLDSGTSLPDDPAQDGTYNLQNTVSGGTGTLSWASGSSGGGVLVVHADENGTLDKTWAEINTAAQTGPVILYDAPSVSYLVAVADGGEGEYLAAFFGSFGASIDEYTTNSESGYPAAPQDGR